MGVLDLLPFRHPESGWGRVAEDSVAAAFDAWGGGLRAVVTPTVGLLACDCLPEHLGDAFDYLRRITGPGRIPNALFERERTSRTARIEDERDDPAEDACFRVRQRLFAGCPLASAPLGFVEDLAGAGVDRMDTFAEEVLDPGRMVVAVSGSFEMREAREFAAEWIGSRERAGPHECLKEASCGEPFIDEAEHRKEQSVVVQAFPVPGLGRGDFRLPMLVGSCLNGLSGPLFEEVRERHGLAYYSGTRMLADRRQGVLAVVSGCAAAKAAFLAEQVRRVCDRLAVEGFSEAEWEAGLAQCRSGLLFGRQRTAWRVMRMATRKISGLPVDMGAGDERFWECVSPGQARDWCAEFLATERESRFAFYNDKRNGDEGAGGFSRQM